MPVNLDLETFKSKVKLNNVVTGKPHKHHKINRKRIPVVTDHSYRFHIRMKYNLLIFTDNEHSTTEVEYAANSPSNHFTAQSNQFWARTFSSETDNLDINISAIWARA